MRLINIDTLEMKEFFEHNTPRYAVLSHTWGDEEISFQDWQTIASFPELLAARPSAEDDAYTALQRRRVELLKKREGYQKILQFLSAIPPHVREGLGVEWGWIDTCCIDKTSSSELSEAINSMFRWYGYAEVCLVYLADVPSILHPQALKSSRWFTRGWTLQELLAPEYVLFLDAEWARIGVIGEEVANQDFAITIQDITGIQEYYLRRKKPFRAASISTRMSWASKRQTTRIEDMAYCLLGIFDVHMPLLYGEGRHAFIRLQEEILKTSTDHTIFAWGFGLPVADTGAVFDLKVGGLDHVLAPSPAYFACGSELEDSGQEQNDYFQMTNKGLNMTLNLRRLGFHTPPLYFASLFQARNRAPHQAAMHGYSLGFLLTRADSSNPDIANGDVMFKFPTGSPVLLPYQPDVAPSTATRSLSKATRPTSLVTRSTDMVTRSADTVTRSIFIPKLSQTLRVKQRGFGGKANLVIEMVEREQPEWRVFEVFPPLMFHVSASEFLPGNYSTYRFQLHYTLRTSEVSMASSQSHQSRKNTASRTWLIRIQGPVPFVLGVQLRWSSVPGTPQPEYLLMVCPPGLLGESLAEQYGEGFPVQGWQDIDQPTSFHGPQGTIGLTGEKSDSTLRIRVHRLT
ncbi:hypothetical protein B0T16DRAFT_409711 [Cercophora newfieldiana]|uniref:Heterokaryon incompatibility domain-containing protein n=1 Tax=Cercophora newfieldiana TaxID=92897 RepID=A0AA40CU25_9PEZI|nr:hypothetical protein B0T16DRAFT_409711 [Cercophora newfieldiana]